MLAGSVPRRLSRQNLPQRQDPLPPRLDRVVGSSQSRTKVSMSYVAPVKEEKKQKIESKPPTSAITQFDKFKVYFQSDNIPYSAANAIDAGREMARAIDIYVKNGALPLGSEKRAVSWRQTVESVYNATLPSVRIGLCGVTGAGKSTLLNALLGDNLIPTSSFRACTATVTEVSYHPLPEIHASVFFVKEDEWRNEIQALMDEVIPGEGEERPHSPPPNHPTWAKIEEVYPSLSFTNFLNMSADDVLASDVEVRKHLGIEKQIRASDSQEFSEEIQQYVSGTASTSSSQKAGALWPLIVKTRILCDADILSTGAILVDLPGSGDTNVARGSVARNYVGSCDNIWVVAPIVRAVSSESGKAFLGESFSFQLKMDQTGRSNAISFICTKCDDINPLELARELRIQDNVEYQHLHSNLQKRQSARKKLKDRIDAANTDVTQKTRAVNTLIDEARALQAGGNHKNARRHSAGGSILSKRTCNGNDTRVERGAKRRQNDVDEMVEVAQNQASVHPPDKLLEQKQRQLDDAQKRLRDAKQELSAAKSDRMDNEEALKETRRQLNAFCSLKRSEAINLRRTFLQGLFTANGFVKEGISSLPVFCCSAMEYRRHNGHDIYASEEPACTLSKEDTGIPTLAAWCKHIARVKQVEAAQKCMKDLRESVTMLHGLLDEYDNKANDHHAMLKARWASDELGPVRLELSSFEVDKYAVGVRGRLRVAISRAMRDGVKDLKVTIAGTIGKACREAAELAVKEATVIAAEFGRNKKWQTYCATFRRGGEYGKIDLNLDFARPFYARVYLAWMDFFEKNRFVDVGEAINTAVQGVLDEVLASAPPALLPQVRRRTCRAADWCQDRLERAVTAAGNQLNVEQKSVTRMLVPFVRGRLLGVYRQALQESSGKGKFMRMQDVFNTFVRKHSLEIYQDAAKYIEESLFKGVDNSVGEMIRPFSRLVENVDVDMAGLWDKVEEDRTQLVRKQEAKEAVTMAGLQLEMWDKACELHKVEARAGVVDSYPPRSPWG